MGSLCFYHQPSALFFHQSHLETSPSVEEVHVAVCCVHWCHQPFIIMRFLVLQAADGLFKNGAPSSITRLTQMCTRLKQQW